MIVSASRLVTDRHAQVAKWMHENYPEVDHRYEVWHMSKSISKKLDKAASMQNAARKVSGRSQ